MIDKPAATAIYCRMMHLRGCITGIEYASIRRLSIAALPHKINMHYGAVSQLLTTDQLLRTSPIECRSEAPAANAEVSAALLLLLFHNKQEGGHGGVPAFDPFLHGLRRGRAVLRLRSG